MPVPVVRFALTKLKISVTNPEQYKQLFLELSSSFPNHSKIFTDGPKCSENVAAAVATDGNLQTHSLCRHPDNCSIYTAELHAIHLALWFICQSKKKSCLVLFDSLSVLKSISNRKCDNPLLVDLFNLYFKLMCDNKEIVLPGFQGMLASRETVLLTWLLSRLWRSPSTEEWWFLTLILRCWAICMWQSCGKRNGKDIQGISYIRFNPKWMIPIRLMVDVDARKQYYADYILVTLFYLIFIFWKVRSRLSASPVISHVLLNICSQGV